jgi:hypothetical protein
MALGAMPAPQLKQPDPPIDGRSGDAPPKPTNSLELGQEPLSSGPNEGLCSRLGVLPIP